MDNGNHITEIKLRKINYETAKNIQSLKSKFRTASAAGAITEYINSYPRNEAIRDEKNKLEKDCVELHKKIADLEFQLKKIKSLYAEFINLINE